MGVGQPEGEVSGEGAFQPAPPECEVGASLLCNFLEHRGEGGAVTGGHRGSLLKWTKGSFLLTDRRPQPASNTGRPPQPND